MCSVVFLVSGELFYSCVVLLFWEMVVVVVEVSEVIGKMSGMLCINILGIVVRIVIVFWLVCFY